MAAPLEPQRVQTLVTVNCRCGVTLAGAHAHAELLAAMIAAGALDASLAPFSARRFDVPPAV